MINPSQRQLVYISGPLTHGDVEANVKAAIEAFYEIASHGVYAFCPHLFYYADKVSPQSYEFYMSVDLTQLQMMLLTAKTVKLDMVIVRLPGTSRGADLEIATAKATALMHEIPLTIMTYQEWRSRHASNKPEVV